MTNDNLKKRNITRVLRKNILHFFALILVKLKITEEFKEKL